MIMISKNVIGIYEGGGGRIAAGGGLFAGGLIASGLNAACSVRWKNKFEGQGESSPLYKTVVRQAMMYDAGTCALKKAREVGCGGNEDVKMDE